MLIRNLKVEDRIGWIGMRAKLWAEEPVDKLIHDTFVIIEGACFHNGQRKWKVFILENDEGKLCGFLEASAGVNKENGTASVTASLEGLFIESSFRKKGWGRKLVEKMEEWAKSEGCTEIVSETNIYRKAGIESYRSMGYAIIFKDDKKVRLRKEL